MAIVSCACGGIPFRLAPVKKEILMEKKGFLGSLFDFSFTSFVFPKVISFVYAVFVVFAGLGYISGVVFGFNQSSMIGLGALVLGPLVLILYLIMIRAWMEIAIVMFRIYDNTDRMVEMRSSSSQN